MLACRQTNTPTAELSDFYRNTATTIPVTENDFTVVSTFGPRLQNDTYDFHRGIDIAGNRNDPILAVADGEIVAVYDEGSEEYPDSGRVILIEHQFTGNANFHGSHIERYYSLYAHLESFSDKAEQVLQNDSPMAVSAGEIIGAMGDSGNASFVHLHFEIRLQTTCSLSYQTTHPQADCASFGFDPHINPLPLLLQTDSTSQSYSLNLSKESDQLVISVSAERPHFDIDGIMIEIYERTSSQNLLFSENLFFNTREGFDATSTEALDNNEIDLITITPQSLGSSANLYTIDFAVDLSDLPNANFGEVSLWNVRGRVQRSELDF